MRGRFGHLRREDKQREPHKVSAESQGAVPGPRDTARCVVSKRGRVPRVHGADEPERGRYIEVWKTHAMRAHKRQAVSDWLNPHSLGTMLAFGFIENLA